MAQEKRFSELDNLFDNGLNMNALPVGLAAGTPFALWAGDKKLIAEWLDLFTDKNWRGKVYFSSTNKRVSQGRNRVRKSFVLPNSPFVPMFKFTTMLLDSVLLAQSKADRLGLTITQPLEVNGENGDGAFD